MNLILFQTRLPCFKPRRVCTAAVVHLTYFSRWLPRSFPPIELPNALPLSSCVGSFHSTVETCWLAANELSGFRLLRKISGLHIIPSEESSQSTSCPAALYACGHHIKCHGQPCSAEARGHQRSCKNVPAKPLRGGKHREGDRKIPTSKF